MVSFFFISVLRWTLYNSNIYDYPLETSCIIPAVKFHYLKSFRCGLLSCMFSMATRFSEWLEDIYKVDCFMCFYFWNCLIYIFLFNSEAGPFPHSRWIQMIWYPPVIPRTLFLLGGNLCDVTLDSSRYKYRIPTTSIMESLFLNLFVRYPSMTHAR